MAFADALLSGIMMSIAVIGVLLCWAEGDLPKLTIAMGIVALVAPAFYRGRNR